MLEETGWRPGQLEHLITVEPANGLSDGRHHVYWARGAEYVGGPEDYFESEKRDWIPLTDVPGMVADGTIRAADAVAALLLPHHRFTVGASAG